MKILLLGVGMQGKAALYDLTQRKEVTEIIAADCDIEALRAHVDGMGYGRNVRCEQVDVAVAVAAHGAEGAEEDFVIGTTGAP